MLRSPWAFICQRAPSLTFTLRNPALPWTPLLSHLCVSQKKVLSHTLLPFLFICLYHFQGWWPFWMWQFTQTYKRQFVVHPPPVAPNLCCPGQPRTRYIDQGGLELTETCQLLLGSATIPDIQVIDKVFWEHFLDIFKSTENIKYSHITNTGAKMQPSSRELYRTHVRLICDPSHQCAFQIQLSNIHESRNMAWMSFTS